MGLLAGCENEASKVHTWSESVATCSSLDPGIDIFGAQARKGVSPWAWVNVLCVLPSNSAGFFCISFFLMVSGDWHSGNLRGCLQEAASLAL